MLSTSSSTSTTSCRWKYDVFLSFRGEDTRLNFVNHLYAALDHKGIVTFRDDMSLERGKSISSELCKAIEESKFAIVILSPNYASSSWCLDELLKIIQCREEKGQVVMPVFYHVDPSHVRKNKDYFLQACTEHEQVHWENRDKVRKWRAALTEVANLSGWDLKNKPEAEAINGIVKDILDKSQYTSAIIYKGMVGMDSRVDDLLTNHIRPRIDDVRMIGIHGMQGIEMGREMVRRESPNDPGKRSRLWSPEDIHKTLKRNKGTEAVQGMVLDLPKLEEAHWKPEAFSNMSELNLLQIRNVDLANGINCLSDSLKLLEWSGYPLRSLPQNFGPDELIEFSLCHSKIEQLWQGIKNFDKLKFIKLCHSHNIIETPDLTGAYSLEKLDLEGCINLVRVHKSLGTLKKLIVLNLKSCESLESLPDIIEMESLEFLFLSGCSKIKKIPEFHGNMKCLSELYLDRTAIEDLPRSLQRLSGLSSLDLSNCKRFGCPLTTIIGQQEIGARAQDNDGSESGVTCFSTSNILEHDENSNSQGYGVIQDSSSYLLTHAGWGYLPDIKPRNFLLCICALRNLTDLNISNCNLYDSVLHNFGWPSSLMALNLSGNDIIQLPPGIRSLLKLENINLENCKKLENLQNLPSSCKLDVRADGCSSLDFWFDIRNHARLETSYFSFINCMGLVTLANIEFIYRTLKRQVINRTETFQIVYLGSTTIIPRWFTLGRAIGSSVFTYTMGPLLYSSRLVGFALCAEFAIDGRDVVDELHTQYFKTFKATHHLVCYLNVNGIDLEVLWKTTCL